MKPLALLGLALAMTSCGTNTTALDPVDGGTGGTGTAGEGGGGSPGRGHPDGSIEVTGGSGGSGGSTGGAGGSTGGAGGSTGGSSGTGGAIGGSGGTTGPDAGPPDAGKSDASMGDAGDMCQVCNGLIAEYGEAVRKEQACNPGLPSQCLKQTPSQLTCGCPVWVNSTVLSDDVRSRSVAAGCQKCFRFMVCPAIACVNPGTGACVPVAAADPGAPIVAPPLQKGQCMTKF